MTEIPLGTESIVDESNEMRERYLEQVALRTVAGLGLVLLTLVLSFKPIILSGAYLQNRLLLSLVLGGLLVTHVVARRMVRARFPVAGLVLGMGALGVAFLPACFLGVFGGLRFWFAVVLTTVIAYGLACEGARLTARLGESQIWREMRLGIDHTALLLRIGLGMQSLEFGMIHWGTFQARLIMGVVHAFWLMLTGLLLVLAVGALLRVVDRVHSAIPIRRPTEAAFELTEGLVLFFWAQILFVIHL